MKTIRGRADARWLPSRHRFALFRLYAFLRLRRAEPEPRAGLMLVVDRDQTAFEHHGASLWIVLTLTCYVAATLFPSWPVPLALLAAVPVAAALIEVSIVGGGLLLRGRGAGILVMLLLGGASAYLARQSSWVRFVAWQFFGLIAVNAVAAAVVFLLRGPIARAEREIPSEG